MCKFKPNHIITYALVSCKSTFSIRHISYYNLPHFVCRLAIHIAESYSSLITLSVFNIIVLFSEPMLVFMLNSAVPTHLSNNTHHLYFFGSDCNIMNCSMVLCLFDSMALKPVFFSQPFTRQLIN